jgi:hypothetical protein
VEDRQGSLRRCTQPIRPALLTLHAMPRNACNPLQRCNDRPAWPAPGFLPLSPSTAGGLSPGFEPGPEWRGPSPGWVAV